MGRDVCLVSGADAHVVEVVERQGEVIKGAVVVLGVRPVEGAECVKARVETNELIA